MLKTCATRHRQRRGEPVTLNFANAEIEAVARTMATITGRNVVVDPRVKGRSPRHRTRRAAWPAFEPVPGGAAPAGLHGGGGGGLYKVVPEADAKLQGGSVSVAQAAPAAGGRADRHADLPLNHENAANLVPVLRPLISPNNTINVNPGNNSLVITDYADNLQRLGASSRRWMCPTPPMWRSSRCARHGHRPGAAGGAPDGNGSSQPARPAPPPGRRHRHQDHLLAEPRSNALMLRAANPPAWPRCVRWSKLDQPPARRQRAAATSMWST
jgi:general secretion pathway protein D